MITKRILSFGLFQLINLVVFSQSEPDFFGVTRKGGDNDGGVIYKTNKDLDNYELIYDFKKNDGREPTFTNVIEFDGKLIGCTRYGGTFNTGIIFEYNPVINQYTNVVNLNNQVGSQPWGSLVVANNQKIYGLARLGGTLQKGTIFEYDPVTKTAVKKIDFDGSNKGGEPVGSLCLADNGVLYGLTNVGGNFGQGVLFSFDPENNNFTKLHDFSGFGFGDGAQPKSDLIQASNGKLYGTTTYGGINDQGTIFEYDIISATYSVKHSFSASTTGKNPWSGKLLEYPAGKLWGMTIVGGTNDFGVIYNYILSSGAVTKIHNFSGGSNGENPGGGLVLGNDNLLYGVTQKGGSNNAGIIFSLNPNNNAFIKKYNFNNTISGGTPFGSLFKASDNFLYGLNSAGGQYNNGVLFQFSVTTNTLVKKHDFGFVGSGFSPVGDLVMSGKDTLYGMTTYGGAQSGGVIYELNLNNNNFTKKFDLSFYFGVFPVNGFCVGLNNLLYGTATEGGVSNNGTFFEYNKKTNSLVRYPIHDINGKYPNSKITESSNGKLYGMTNKGGDFDKGIIFEFDPVVKNLKRVLSFDGSNTGSFPDGDLVERNGKLYGHTNKGGAFDQGVLFSFNPVNYEFQKLFDFSGLADGANPATSLTEKNGVLFGICQSGGSNDDGVIFKYDLFSGQFEKIFEFNGFSTGSFPNGKLRFNSSDILVGSTEKGGLYDKGTLFTYNINTNIFTKKYDFDGLTGDGPYHSGLGHQKSLNNNYCFGALQIDVNEQYCENVFIDNNLESVNSRSGPFPNCGLFSGPDKWYKIIVPSSGKLQVEMSRIGTFTDGAMAVYSGSCEALVLLSCDDDSNENPGTGHMPALSLTDLIPASILYLRIWSKNNQKHGEYSLCIWNPVDIEVSAGGYCVDGVDVFANSLKGNLYSWLPIQDSQEKLIAFVYPNGNSLGSLRSKIYTTNSLPLRRDGDGKPYINRDIQILSQNSPDLDSVFIRLCYGANEINDLMLELNSEFTIDQLNVTKNELDCSGTFIMPGKLFSQIKNSVINATGDRYFEFKVPSFSTFYLHGGNIALPVILNKFIGKNNGDYNIIEWEIEKACKPAAISLQRSFSGSDSWENIAVYKESDQYIYSFTDEAISELSYYRLLIEDVSGHHQYSDILKIISEKKNNFKVLIYPNPVTNTLNLGIAGNLKKEFNYGLYDFNGKQIFSRNSEDTLTQINISEFASGLYYIKTIIDNNIFFNKVIFEK